ncbi:energy-coupling factor ABC transporter ATP-binding protein [Desulfonema magnum]|uniref:ABC transporter, ATP-binding protein n=1 Tax=Desulfonema magnum TaxID=45655 RepID=A0A975BM15_9BACT|nr:ATP-binding cassette domain-containing protein [Desulfonema magnum]QTA87520.1 putative ABC transporter, ATP-binding protein [Desulfonema magnum]
MNILEIINLTHRFSNGAMGIENINLMVREGEFVVISGQNGSGKTTLLRHLNGLFLPTAGTVILDGISVSENVVRARQMVGMVFQDADSQIVGETVSEDVAFGPENLCLSRPEIKKRVSHALNAVGLASFADQRPHVLSGGEKRRLAIAGVLAMNPKILVFDEPFSNLDYPGVRQILKQILSLHEAGHTILLTTHDLEKVLGHANRLVIMKDGKIVRDGTPDQIVTDVETYGVRQPCASRLGMEIGSWLN